MESEFALKEPTIKLHRKYLYKLTNIFYRIKVFVGAGSRHEDVETSGAAYHLERMLLRGTSSKSKQEISQDIESLGARYSADTGREISSFGL
jgi:predicted Zn-dependent peptidase